MGLGPRRDGELFAAGRCAALSGAGCVDGGGGVRAAGMRPAQSSPFGVAAVLAGDVGVAAGLVARCGVSAQCRCHSGLDPHGPTSGAAVAALCPHLGRRRCGGAGGGFAVDDPAAAAPFRCAAPLRRARQPAGGAAADTAHLGGDGDGGFGLALPAVDDGLGLAVGAGGAAAGVAGAPDGGVAVGSVSAGPPFALAGAGLGAGPLALVGASAPALALVGRLLAGVCGGGAVPTAPC